MTFGANWRPVIVGSSVYRTDTRALHVHTRFNPHFPSDRFA